MEFIEKNNGNLIKDLCDWKLTKSEFEAKTDFKADFQQLNSLLDETENSVTENNDNQYFDAIFWTLPCILSLEEKANLFRKYLLKNWHHEHEEIAGSFQGFFYNDKDNIQVLLQAIDNIPNYLNRNDLKYPYIRKLIYAIGAQPEPFNIETLEKLASETIDMQIKELALHQIKKRRELGRWEAAKNLQ